MPQAPSVSNETGWDALFAALKKDRVWGVITVQLKEGDPSVIKLDRSFKDVQAAVAAIIGDSQP